MLADRDRLRRRAAVPHLIRLHRALGRLRSTVTVMNTGAHPDDEHNDMLAVLRHQHGARIVIACSTRGEGGQNTLGPERQAALGVLRSREMEEAARVLDADIAWLGHGPDDPVHDFGFSKSGEDTLARWGRALTLERLVRAYRQFRPDIVIPTFLDVPGQHGHHRAMTQAAQGAIALAADPDYRTDDLPPWQVAKFYLPAWSGGGATYDDEVPPPPATTTIEAIGVDAATGLSFERLGEVSRANHASQNMGFWRYPPATTWPLHLVNGAPEPDIFQGLPGRLADLGGAPALAEADAGIDEALARFPDGDAVRRALFRARSALQDASPNVDPWHTHRLARKVRELDVAIGLAAGIDVDVALSSDRLAPGGSVDLVVEAAFGNADSISVAARTGTGLSAPGATSIAPGITRIPLQASADAEATNGFLPDWQSLGGNGLVSIDVMATVDGSTIQFSLDPEEPLQIDPLQSVSVVPEAIIVPLGQTESHAIRVKGVAARQLQIPPVEGLAVEAGADGLVVTPTADLPPGRHSLKLMLDGAPAHSSTPIAYPHIGRTRLVRPQQIDVLALDLAVPTTRVGYIGGGADRVGLWLGRMGVALEHLDAEALAGDLAHLDTIVVGLFAFGTRPDLQAATPRLHEWVAKGGHLVTFYHRPSDGWRPEATPPRRLVIGSPSLRWRVTDPAAPVTLLAPDHKLLTGPNRIADADFAQWDKERGLYFASSWDKAYVPLLSMSDAGEAPLVGSLLSAEIGRGRHTHTSLVLHHQMDRLVPGAFRLMANLLQPA
ncbi:PIG-L family deacetylase [Devosia sp. PTR5]|uniref:PIG-L family deacetylase n=1 Tax=Devosia oryzisoli TaxID=2774138 RepID=A0A927FWB1_9HYPH|nr:PIG-L family deacetylase [Devosia oryzisoli]MBD8065196.1 PIG-L family deacetylase [Devosia oryzisoli]